MSRPNDVRRIVLEGLPGAGKTLVTTWLSERLGVATVAEWVVEERVAQSQPAALPHYLVNDLRKEALARSSREAVVLMDRHYLGALAFTRALGTAPLHLRPRGESVARNHYLYEKALSSGSLTPAAILVVLDIPPALSLKRQPRARRSEPLFGDLCALETMREFYLRRRNPSEVVVIDATRPRQLVIEEVATVLVAQTPA